LLFELSPRHENITVTALARRDAGYHQDFDCVEKCEHCGGFNGIRYTLRQQAA